MLHARLLDGNPLAPRILLDVLADTAREHGALLTRAFVTSLEEDGETSHLADVVINWTRFHEKHGLESGLLAFLPASVFAKTATSLVLAADDDGVVLAGDEGLVRKGEL